MAHAIYRCSIPLISAVGHEPDVTISDYVADLRAATPSNAAELAVPDQDALRQTLDGACSAMCAALTRHIRSAKQHLKVLSDSPALRSPMSYFEQRRINLNHLRQRLLAVQGSQLDRKRQRAIGLTAKLDAMSPLKVLTRGYAMTQTADGTLVRSVKQITTGDHLKISLSDGMVSATVTDIKEDL